MKVALHPEAVRKYGSIAAWLRYVRVEGRDPNPTAESLLALAEHNVVAQLENLRTHPAVAARLKDESLELHGWVYHIGSGAVTAYDEASGKFVALE